MQQREAPDLHCDPELVRDLWPWNKQAAQRCPRATKIERTITLHTVGRPLLCELSHADASENRMIWLLNPGCFFWLLSTCLLYSEHLKTWIQFASRANETATRA